MRHFLLLFLSFPLLYGFGQSQGDYTTEIQNYQESYKESFLHYPEGPLDSSDLDDIVFFTINPAYNFDCSFTLTPDAPVFEMSTYSGRQKSYRKYGIATFRLGEKLYNLALYQSQAHLQHPVYKDYLFIPFKDETNGEESYGGGRYIDIQLSDINGDRVRIDFNTAYNPWCAYSSGYNCPIPPIENHFPFPIPAGEKAFKGTYKK